VIRAKRPFEESMRRVRGVIELHPRLHGSRGRPHQHVSDVLRGALVLAVGALDGLVLEAALETIPTVAKVNGLGPNLSKWVREDPERFLAALASPSPHDALVAIAREHLSSMTLQRSQMIESVLRDVSGCEPPWDRAAKRLSKLSGGAWTKDSVRASLDDFVRRRHAIAHSGDIEQGRRATPITLPYVREAANVIEAVGLAVCDVVNLRIRAAGRAAK
jgi:hypothetical protein